MGGDEEASKPEYKSLEPRASNEKKGGFRATTFIYVLAKFESMAFVANMVSLVLYFYMQLHFDLSGSANTLTSLMGSTYLISVLGAFISDSYLNRFSTCMVFGLLEILSLVMMTIQAHDPSLQPSACNKSSCVKGGPAVFFYISMCLLALGAGGVKGALAPLGADQFDKNDDPKEAKSLASYFNYLLLSSTLGSVLGVTVIVWVSTNKGWWRGFLICTVITAFGYVVLALGKPFYRLLPPGEGPVIRIVQVLVVAYKNRRISLPRSSNELHEVDEKESVSREKKISHTNQFRCLDKAAVPLPLDAMPTSWAVCTVTQVEEVKVLTRMVPIIASTVLLNTCMAQLQTFSVQQGARMDRYLGSFEVPASSIPVIPLAFISILIPIYEFFFVPLARKITHHPSGITQLQRVGVGLVLSVISMGVAALVEVKRRNQSLNDPLKPISLFWLSFQYGIFGIADMFTLVGLLEFFYKEAPAGMRSLATSFTWIPLSFGYFLSSAFVDIINSVTKRVSPSKEGWLYGQDLDRNKLDRFYWFLAILSCLNFVNYVYWSKWYEYKTEEPKFEPTTVSIKPFLKEEESSTGDSASSAIMLNNGSHLFGKEEEK